MRFMTTLTLVSLLAGCTAPQDDLVPPPPGQDEQAPLLQIKESTAALQGSFDANTLAGACVEFSDLRVEGNVTVKDIDGELPDLSCLQVVTGDLVVSANSELSSLAAFSELRYVGGDVLIAHNPELLDLLGLDRLRSAGSVTVEGNPSLLDLEGLDSLVDVRDTFTIRANDGIQSLEGLLSLGDTWSGSFVIADNADLRDLAGLDSLAHVSGGIEISENPVLGSMEGLQGLRTLGDTLRVHANDGLTDIDALLDIEAIGGDLLVTDNPRLSAESVDALVEAIAEIEGSVILRDNGE
ncbi:MAG: hypothetical protein KDA24_26750 [Deltaproteobacteria bacterium]|nr:hypothetical protein [Deltaproteobacteria bacterium]